MRGHVDDGIDVRLKKYWFVYVKVTQNIIGAYEGDTSEVPEDDKESPLLVEHVPSLRNTFLTLADI